MKMVDDAQKIFGAGLKRVDPSLMIRECLAVDGELLRIQTESETAEFDLSGFREILVVGAGKASAKMAPRSGSGAGRPYQLRACSGERGTYREA